jgi:4-hydroxybenzoate polyprenyltransferase
LQPKFKALLQLTRPANIITAIADIMLGFAISGSVLSLELITFDKLGWLVLATIGLYGGGVVFNDVFDVKLDAIERPERPIPSGIISKGEASILGAILLLIGIFSAFFVSPLSGYIAIAIASLALLYDAYSKHHVFFGPLNMGACRAGNLLLGISAVNIAVWDNWFVSLIPIFYIGAITLISQGEVHGGNRKSLFIGLGLYILVFGIIISLCLLPGFKLGYILPMMVLFGYSIFKPLIDAIKGNAEPKAVMLAVKAGVMSVIILDATIATGFAGLFYGCIVLALLPLSRFLAKQFAVT